MQLFVYGTLKRGERSHERFCSQASCIEPAWTWGRLYALPQGYPMLKAPPERILHHGTAELADDIVRHRDALPIDATEPPPGDWHEISGELVTLPDDTALLAAIDAWEGFQPPQQQLYNRVLLPVYLWSADAAFAAWAYVAPGGVLPSREVDCGASWSNPD